MLPLLNGKPLTDWNEDDLNVLLDNPDYRENEHIDYKRNFSFIESPKGKERGEKLSEFRNDVCSFANSDGGYLLYGISDNNGMAHEIMGIDIADSNTDKFELDRKNNLQTIMPKMPSVQFVFISLSTGKFVVALQIKNDGFAPYVHLENECDYKIYKREGNGKIPIGYMELKNMFNNSLSLDNEITKYRMERIRFYRSIEDNGSHDFRQFLLLHLIPDTFADTSYNKNMFLIKRKNRGIFYNMFGDVGCANVSIPCVDGLRFPHYKEKTECMLKNNGVVECFEPIGSYLNIGYQEDKYPFGFFASDCVWDHIFSIVSKYIDTMKSVLDTQRVFACISILGCKNVVTDTNFYTDFTGKIDRDTVLCPPVVLQNINDADDVTKTIKRLHIEYALALGITHSKTLDKLIQEVYE